jgi:hypothetical protein
MKVIIAFRSGNKLELEVKDPVVLVESIVKGLESNATRCWYREGGVLFCTSEIDYVCAADMALTTK